MTVRRADSRDEKRALGAFVKLMRAAETVAAHTHRHLADEGLTPTQFGVLEALYHLGPLNQRTIGKKLLKSSGNITTVVDNLEGQGLVRRRRQVEDRRFVTVELTEVGRERIAALFPRHAEAVVAELSVLTPAEQEELSRLCRKLGLRNGRSAPGPARKEHNHVESADQNG